MLNSMINVSFWNILKLVRTGSLPAPAKHLPLVVLKIDKAEGMEPFPECYLSCCGIVRMGTIVIDRKTAIDLQDTPIVTP